MQKKSTRVLSLVLSIAMVITMMAGAMTASAVSYKDVNSSHWAKSYIDYLSDKNVFTGYTNGTFKPDQTVTTAELMAIISRTFGLSATKAISYADVKSTDWYYTYVSQAAAQGYILDGSYVYPNQPLTREKAVAMIARYLGLETSGSGYYRFSDSNQISSAYKGYVDAAVAEGIINGYTDGTFKPQKEISRAEIAKIVYTMLGGNIIRENVTGATSNGACITKNNVTVSNSYLGGTVYVTEGAYGNVTFNGSTITKLVVRGNTSVNLVNTKVGTLVLDSSNGSAAVYASGSSSVQSTTVSASATLTDSTTNGGVYGKVVSDMPAGGKLSLNGIFTNVTVNGYSNYLEIGAASKVASLTVSSAASNAKITGKGIITAINVSASGCTTEQMPEQYVIATKYYAMFGGTKYTGSGSAVSTETGFVEGYPYAYASSYSTSNKTSITLIAKAVTDGELYAVAYPVGSTVNALSASSIIGYSSSDYNYYGTSGSMNANAEKTFFIDVPKNTTYAIAVVFVPKNGDSTTCKPVYANLGSGSLTYLTTSTEIATGFLQTPYIQSYTGTSATIYAETGMPGTFYVLPYSSSSDMPSSSTIRRSGSSSSMSYNASRGVYTVETTVSTGSNNMVAVLFEPYGNTSSYYSAYGRLKSGTSLSGSNYDPEAPDFSVSLNGSAVTITFNQEMYSPLSFGGMVRVSTDNIRNHLSVTDANGRTFASSNYNVSVDNFSGYTVVTLTLVSGQSWPYGAKVNITGLRNNDGVDCTGSQTFYGSSYYGTLTATVVDSNTNYSSNSTISDDATLVLNSGKTFTQVYLTVPAGHKLYKTDGTLLLDNSGSYTSDREPVKCYAGNTYSYYTTYGGSYASSISFTVTANGSAGTLTAWVDGTGTTVNGNVTLPSGSNAVKITISVPAGQRLYESGSSFALNNISSSQTTYSKSFTAGDYYFYTKNSSGTTTGTLSFKVSATATPTALPTVTGSSEVEVENAEATHQVTVTIPVGYSVKSNIDLVYNNIIGSERVTRTVNCPVGETVFSYSTDGENWTTLATIKVTAKNTTPTPTASVSVAGSPITTDAALAAVKVTLTTENATGYTWNYSVGNKTGNLSSGVNTLVLSGLVNGDYTITVTGTKSNSTVTETATFTVDIPEPPTTVATVTVSGGGTFDNVAAAGAAEITITVDNDTGYEWYYTIAKGDTTVKEKSKFNNLDTTSLTDMGVTPEAGYTYTVTVTGECEGKQPISDSVTVTVTNAVPQ